MIGVYILSWAKVWKKFRYACKDTCGQSSFEICRCEKAAIRKEINRQLSMFNVVKLKGLSAWENKNES